MHAIRLTNIGDGRQLTLAVRQIGQMLGFYYAEVARILGLRCEDVGALIGQPLLLLVDKDGIDAVIRYLETETGNT